MIFPASLALFCRVIDNYGDIGICWRLARQLQTEHGIAVTLWVDDLVSFRRLCPAVDPGAASQRVEGVALRHWASQDQQFAPGEVADIVIEFFAVDIPPGYVDAMARCDPRPVWLNLEGLSAEDWVEGCHRLPSMHPRLPLTKHFFFPGFTASTGGLLCERTLAVARAAFQADPAAMAAFLAPFGVTAAQMDTLKVSLFCYPHAPVAPLFAAWRASAVPITCLVPDGVAADAVTAFLGAPAVPGATATHGALTVHVLPFVAQPDYDKLLWACDFNFVRGEDSFVRAQWAGRPFVWHIYPQDDDLHHVKLRAFLRRYTPATAALAALSWYWNGGADGDAAPLWQENHAELGQVTHAAAHWEAQMRDNGDLASNLVQFACTLRPTLHTTAFEPDSSRN